MPGAVLFACNYNRVRSPMAAGLMRRLYGARVFADSVGLRPPPGGWDIGETADPFTVRVMDELGVDLATHRPRTFDDLEDESFDLVVSLTPEAHHRAIEFARGRATDVEYWPTLDPTLATGAREAVLDAYRSVRDGLQSRLIARFGAVRTFGG
ncbi:MAG TPA: low molecular weight phosphatase family protein [Caulobacteraceae bacterium]|nr:low molecular weight phosphatase family protein [Caulobacteraceae bacterium]